MTDSKDERKPAEVPKPAKPVVPPFRGPGSPGASPLRPFDANARGTRPPFVPPTIPGRKPVTPARPASTTPPAAPAGRVEPVAPERPATPARAPRVVTPAATRPVTPVVATVVAPVEAPSTRDAEVIARPMSSSTAMPVSLAPSGTPDAAEPFVDPAPFVGTREAVAEARSEEIEDTAQLPEPVAAPDSVVAEREATPVEPAAAVAAIEGAYRASASMNALTDTGPSHPLARTLRDLASRIERRELEVRGYEDGMTPETSLAVLLAELLKRPR